MKPLYACTFTAELIRYPGEGGWVFATVLGHECLAREGRPDFISSAEEDSR